jgi:hypothetical protein
MWGQVLQVSEVRAVVAGESAAALLVRAILSSLSMVTWASSCACFALTSAARRRSICITPLRKGAMLACWFSFVFAVYQIVTYGVLLSVSEREAPPMFLQLLYWLQLLFGAGLLVLSFVTYVAIKTQHVRLMSGGRSMPLLFSRLLRFGLWLSLFAFFFVWFRSNEACGVIERQGQSRLMADSCRCIKEETDATGRGPPSIISGQQLDQMCKPKDYHICESPLVDQYSGDEWETAPPEVIGNINKCRWCGLDLDGDVDADGVLDHRPCTPQECVREGCRYEKKTCPSRAQDFQDEIDEQEELARIVQGGGDNPDRDHLSFFMIRTQATDECHYDEEGRLISLNITAGFEGPHSQVDEYLDTGVLRLVHGTDDGLEWALERGGWEFENLTSVMVANAQYNATSGGGVARGAKNGIFFEFSLCLSRACLGKIIVFYI